MCALRTRAVIEDPVQILDTMIHGTLKFWNLEIFWSAFELEIFSLTERSTQKEEEEEEEEEEDEEEDEEDEEEERGEEEEEKNEEEDT